MEQTKHARRFIVAMGAAWGVLLLISLWPHDPQFRHWERLREGPFNFREGVRLTMVACGDLGRNSWIPSLRHWRRLTFSTDLHGFRNPVDIGWPRIVVLGDSYVVGSGLDDDETIPAALSDLLGEPVYNYGGVARLAPLVFLHDRRARTNPPEIVVWAPASRAIEPVHPGRPTPSSAGSPGGRLPLRVQDFLPGWSVETARRIDRWRGRLEEQNSLTVLSKLLVHGAFYWLTGRPWEIRAIQHGGEIGLVLTLKSQRLDQDLQERRLDEIVESVVQLDRILGSRGSRLVFAPIPGAGIIYADRYPESERRRCQEPPFLDYLLYRLEARGVACVDLRPAMLADRVTYLYLRDDTHLSASGARSVARALATYIESL